MTTTGESTALAFEFGPELDKLSAALVTFQGKVGAVAKTKTAKVQMKSGGSYTYDYADLADVIASTKDARIAANLAVVQMPVNSDRGITIITTILHSSGQWMRSSLTMFTGDSSPQAIGSLITYGRRYSYSAALGICTEADDDGNAAQGHNAQTGGRGADPKARGPLEAAGRESVKPAAGKTEPTTKTAPPTRSADIKHDGSKATPQQIKLLHTLKSKLGMQECDGSCARDTVKVTKTKGNVPITVRCVYHAQLAKFTDQAGNAITTSTDLSGPQMSNLLDRYTQQAAKAADKAANLRPIDMGAIIPINREPGDDDGPNEEMATPDDLADLETAAGDRWGDSYRDCFPEWLKGAFDYDTVMELRRQEAIDATRMIRAGK